MQYATNLKWIIAAFLAVMILGRVGCYYASKKIDTYRRPWAYSDDPAEPLLVGKWKGSCTDADRVVHNVELEIFEPMSDDERWAKKFRKRSRRDRGSATFSTAWLWWKPTANGTPANFGAVWMRRMAMKFTFKSVR